MIKATASHLYSESVLAFKQIELYLYRWYHPIWSDISYPPPAAPPLHVEYYEGGLDAMGWRLVHGLVHSIRLGILFRHWAKTSFTLRPSLSLPPSLSTHRHTHTHTHTLHLFIMSATNTQCSLAVFSLIVFILSWPTPLLHVYFTVRGVKNEWLLFAY